VYLDRVVSLPAASDDKRLPTLLVPHLVDLLELIVVPGGCPLGWL
jgi:hypothetical protein